MKSTLTLLLLAPFGLALAQEPVEPEAARPIRMGTAAGAPIAAPAGAEDAMELAVKLGFRPMLLRHWSGEALPDFDLLAADGATVKFSAARGSAPTVVVMAPSIGDNLSALRDGAEAIREHYADYGVKVLYWGLWQAKDEFLAAARDEQQKRGIVLFGDPAGPYAGDAGDQDARMAHHRTTVLGRLFQGGMTTPLPACFVVGADGKLAGSFGMRGAEPPFDGIGNLLLRAGVKLADQHMPKKVAPAAVFAKPPERAPEAPVEMVEAGTKAADFAMVGVDGQPVRLADHAGKVVVLDFWATWCGPCKAALPHVQELAAHYKDQGVVVIASCTNDSKKAFDGWIKEHAAKYPDIVFAFDPLERSPERGSRVHYGVSGIPQQFVVGRDGVIKSLVTGYMMGEVLLDAALAAAGVEVPAEVLEKAKADQLKRDEMDKTRKVKPALPLKPAGG
ncbi:MAG: TlpA family protein disulfide reductase [Planctomycetes bacterium]|nr:TlpA family protein disulfide reductase [Planctomycetota bacterium]